jgi:hypothetical protein
VVSTLNIAPRRKPPRGHLMTVPFPLSDDLGLGSRSALARTRISATKLYLFERPIRSHSQQFKPHQL